MTERIPSLETGNSDVIQKWMELSVLSVTHAGILTPEQTKGLLPELDRDDLKSYFESKGAKFDNLSEGERSSLRKYTNAKRALGMRAVWGGTFDDYKKFCSDWAKKYEERTTTRLPRLGKKPKKGEEDRRPVTSGMIQMFDSLTAYAVGAMSWEDFEKYTVARIHNGQRWILGRKKERMKVDVPTAEDPIRVSSIPPRFMHSISMFLSELDTTKKPSLS